MARVTADTKQATRARLLAAAAEEFSRAGLERANIDAISLAAGCGKGTIYNYFPSKEELFLAVVEEASAQAGSSRPARDDALARVLVRECLMGTPGLYPRVIRAEWPLTGDLEAIVEDGAGRGELRGDIPAGILALAIAGLTDLALAQHWASGGSRPGLEEIPDLVLTLLLGPPPAGHGP